ncbi:hypothetical protein ASF49_21360 [Methylobacterium sp. Leaf104]|uniref:hypothetical protein n=1 Tax=Methylobacterium TaxID=407 RepID=UPI00070005EE|nr:MULTISPECIES: hypothetical protein [Methylobacterium]KQP40056.1 hypothetical protein ASF49_21360 [Methylobacterium sp. Leaf104]MCI9881937.1 hypothetical protein [Methylobacterium goesingense]
MDSENAASSRSGSPLALRAILRRGRSTARLDGSDGGGRIARQGVRGDVAAIREPIAGCASPEARIL